MPVSILQARIKLLNAPFHLVFLLLTVTFRAPHSNLLSHFHLPIPFPFQADRPHHPSPAAQTSPLPGHPGTREKAFLHTCVSHCHLISLLIGYYFCLTRLITFLYSSAFTFWALLLFRRPGTPNGRFCDIAQPRDSGTCLFACSLSPSKSQRVPPPAVAPEEV